MNENLSDGTSVSNEHTLRSGRPDKEVEEIEIISAPLPRIRRLLIAIISSPKTPEPNF